MNVTMGDAGPEPLKFFLVPTNSELQAETDANQLRIKFTQCTKTTVFGTFSTDVATDVAAAKPSQSKIGVSVRQIFTI